jgi:hypothetical protein
MKNKLAILAAILPTLALGFAYRVPCEIQADQPVALKTMTWQQGTTPLVQFDVLNGGQPVTADTNATVRLIFGPSATSQYYVPITNNVATSTYYRCQVPTVGTNTAGAAWWYTVYFEDAQGHRYWTGNGSLYIEATTSTADGLTWQTVVTGNAIAVAATNYTDAAVAALATTVSNSFLRVYDTGGGVWKTLVPGETP